MKIVTIDGTKDDMELNMSSVTYSDGFNKSVFEQVLYHLNLCVKKAKAVIG
jgi:hypothetical protein